LKNIWKLPKFYRQIKFDDEENDEKDLVDETKKCDIHSEKEGECLGQTIAKGFHFHVLSLPFCYKKKKFNETVES
jgi:hypothetical protein